MTSPDVEESPLDIAVMGDGFFSIKAGTTKMALGGV